MGLVYDQICSETGLRYFGITTQTMKERIWKGWKKCTCKNFIKPIITILEDNIDDDKLIDRENWYIQNNECVNLQGKYKNMTKKEYRIINKDIIKERNKQYYLDNIKSISEKMKHKITCDNCGSIIRKDGIYNHKKTKKCLNYI